MVYSCILIYTQFSKFQIYLQKLNDEKSNNSKDSKLIGDELIEKFISQDKKVLKYIDSFYSTESVKKHSEIKLKTSLKNKDKFWLNP